MDKFGVVFNPNACLDPYYRPKVNSKTLKSNQRKGIETNSITIKRYDPQKTFKKYPKTKFNGKEEDPSVTNDA